MDLDIRLALSIIAFILEENIDLSGITPGKYALHLKIADQIESLKDRPEYCIQLANNGVWDETTGWNILKQTIEVTE